MAADTQVLRGLLTKRPFYRISPESPEVSGRMVDVAEMKVTYDYVVRNEVTQADFIRELDTESHAINNREIYKTYWQKDEDGLYYEADFPRYAFPFQQEILDDRLARLTGNDIQFDLADIDRGEAGWDTYNQFKAGWADKSMERAWHYLAKSVLSTGDGAFVGILREGKFSWKVFSYANGDVLYPHYDKLTGKLNIFARTYTDYDEKGVSRKYIDVWDDKFYYRLVDMSDEQKPSIAPDSVNEDGEQRKEIKGYNYDGYELDIQPQRHGFDRIPVAYKRCETGPCWAAVQEIIEHYEAGMSRLAQSNMTFGMPAMVLTGDGKEMEEIATSDLTYASKIFLVPSDGKLELLHGEDASNAYKTELDELRKKIYEGAMVVKAPELKSGDTPAAAIKLLYSDSFNKALLETQEYDEVMNDMVNIFKWGYGVESQQRLAFMNTRITDYILPFIPQNDAEQVQNLALAVQNGFCSKQTASEKITFGTPNEWDRILKEKHDDDMHTLLIEEQRLDMQGEQQVETQEQLAEIQTEQQVEVIEAQAKATASNNEDKAKKVRTSKGSVATGRSAGRPRTVNTDKWGNRANENNWQSWNNSH